MSWTDAIRHQSREYKVHWPRVVNGIRNRIKFNVKSVELCLVLSLGCTVISLLRTLKPRYLKKDQ